MIGSVNKLNYVDHDMEEMRNLPEFLQKLYMESRGEGPRGSHFGDKT
jgi:hypothetical protein